MVSSGKSSEARQAVRARTRLRVGKLVDSEGCLLGECRILDRSRTGARLQMLTPAALPAIALLYDDETRDLVRARLVWHRDGLVGISIIEQVGGAHARALRRTLGRKFYAAR